MSQNELDVYKILNEENDVHIQNYMNDNYDIDSDSLLIKNFWKSLEYYFNDNKDKIKKFISNEKVLLDGKFNILLSYPSSLNNLRTKSLSELSQEVITIIDKNDDRIIHPLLFILCYKYLSKEYDICYIVTKNKYHISKISNPKFKIRWQYDYTFIIYYYLFINENLDLLIKHYKSEEQYVYAQLLEKIYFNFEIEKMVNMSLGIDDCCNTRFIDLCINLEYENEIPTGLTETQEKFYNCVTIEINESHHKPNIDLERKLAILSKTGKVALDFYFLDNELEDIFKLIHQKIGSVLYKNINKQLGISYYLTCIENIHIKYVTFFIDIYNSKNGYQFGKLISIFDGSLKNKDMFIKTCEEELDETNFIEYIENNIMESTLSSTGIDIVLNLPRKKECNKAKKIKEIYTKFREGYFSFLENKLENTDDYLLNILFSRNQEYGHIIQSLIKPFIELYCKKIKKEDIEKYNLIEQLPFLQKSNNRYHKDGVKLNNIRYFFGNIKELKEGLKHVDDGLNNIPKCIYINEKDMKKILQE